jgi:hypothetical protein
MTGEPEQGKSEADAFDALSAAENALREVIEQTLRDAFGETWLEMSGLTTERISSCESKRDEERKRREGAIPDNRILAYSEFHDLTTIINKHWSLFKDCFGDKKQTDTYLGRLSDFRISTMHTRPLLPFERSLVVGMSGEIRNKVAIFRSKGGGSGDPELFPRIERVTDSFGNAKEGKSSGGVAVFKPDVLTTVRPGETVGLECEGWDPEGCELLWRIQIAGRPRAVAKGQTVRFRWEVQAVDIQEVTGLIVTLTAERSYHRYDAYDDVTQLQYKVRPLGTNSP